ncbi:MAG: hypothetical protein CMG74_10675 [Candidatus Marinimicrobia bacterium]|nr:hypothetical protein [Candidatus Neomarinimicrobiota bacterium]
MRILINLVLIFVLVLPLFGQKQYKSVDNIKEEWADYTAFQRDEMVSFCDFLFKEKYYERCLLTCFQFLYRVPDDPLRSTILFTIARCYEEMENFHLAHRYYQNVISLEDKNSNLYRASVYRDIYIDLLSGNSNRIISNTKTTDDPYLLTFKGYAYLKQLKWEQAREAFIYAQQKFNHPHYDELMVPLFQIIENVQNVRTHNKYLIAATGLFIPGGGQFMLRDVGKGQGIFASAGLLAMAYNWSKTNTISGSNRFMKHQSLNIPSFTNIYEQESAYGLKKNDNLPSSVKSSSSHLKYTLPPLMLALGVYAGGFWKSFVDTNDKNRKLIEYYTLDNISEVSPARFLDFPEPNLID